MAALRTKMATTYFAPTARRRFLTRKAAARAEARALVQRKYPTERADYDDAGRCTYGGFHWSNDDRLSRVVDRLTKIILAAKEAQS